MPLSLLLRSTYTLYLSELKLVAIVAIAREAVSHRSGARSSVSESSRDLCGAERPPAYKLQPSGADRPLATSERTTRLLATTERSR